MIANDKRWSFLDSMGFDLLPVPARGPIEAKCRYCSAVLPCRLPWEPLYQHRQECPNDR